MKKSLMALFLVLLICIFQSEQVYANSIASAQLIKSSTSLAPVIAAFAPEVALIACVIVGAGVVYENRDQIVATASTIYNDLKVAGIPLVRDLTTGALTLTQTIKDFIISDISTMRTSGIVSVGAIPHAGTVSFIVQITQPNGATQISYPSYSVPSTGYTFRTEVSVYPNAWLGVQYMISIGAMNYVLANVGATAVILSSALDGVPLPDSSVCVDLPATMFPNSIPAPSAIDIPLNVPLSIPYGQLGKPIEDVIGATDYPSALDRVGAVPYVGDVPVDVPVDEDLDIPTTETGFWGSIIGWLSKILNAIKAIPAAILAFFVIDWSVVAQSLDFTDVFENKFKPFYDITSAFQNISSNPQQHSGKFYMVIPTAMGGDGGSHAVLDFTIAMPYLVWARVFIKWSLWLGLGMYILKLFEPKITIG